MIIMLSQNYPPDSFISDLFSLPIFLSSMVHTAEEQIFSTSSSRSHFQCQFRESSESTTVSAFF